MGTRKRQVSRVSWLTAGALGGAAVALAIRIYLRHRLGMHADRQEGKLTGSQAIKTTCNSVEDALLKKRDEIKGQLVAGEYKTLMDKLLDGIGRIIQKLSRSTNPPSFLYTALVMALATLLIGFLTSILLGEFSLPRREIIPFEISMVGVALSSVIIYKVSVGMFSTILHDSLLDAIESVADLENLQAWLASAFDVKKHLLFSLAYSVFVGLYSPILFTRAMGGFTGFGPIVSVVIGSFQAGMFGYSLILFLTVPIRLSRYHYKLYAADPSSSEVIERLSAVLSNFVYMAAIPVAVVTLTFASFGLLTSAVTVSLVLLVWILLTVLFITNQAALSRMITKAKWSKLNETQAQIERLEARESVLTKETLDDINKLMDYYNRIRNTRDSALDLRTGLNFLNSLLLPLVAILLGNLDKVLDLLR